MFSPVYYAMDGFPKDHGNAGPPLFAASNFAATLQWVLRRMSPFERLTYIPSLHNPAVREALRLEFRAGEDHRADLEAGIWATHLLIFEDWLRLTLEEKLADLQDYALRHGWTIGRVAQEWLLPVPAARLVPRGAQPPEVRLFWLDVESLLSILAGRGELSKL